MTANAATRLLQHYVDNFRVLPWRSPPGEPRTDPYRVWLSEIMLQQTTVATVRPRFDRFLERWPTVAALAAASDAEVMQEWAGLGYYARARNLIACARAVAVSGFPDTEQGLRALPGIGEYTAAAIAAIAFGVDAAPVDTNVARVIARWDGLASPTKRDIADRFLSYCPPGRAGDLAQALMDLGSTICRPRNPQCAVCPVREGCTAARSGEPENFPASKTQAARPRRYGIAWWIQRGGAVWLVRRPPTGLLGGMPALPGPDWSDERPALIDGEIIGTVAHGFTHFALELTVIRRPEPIGDGWWQPLDEIDLAGLPTLYARAASLALVEGARGDKKSTRLEVGEATP